MKSIFLSILAAFTLVQFAQAEDVTVTITKVHLCCDSCVKGVDKAVSEVDKCTAVCDKKARTIVLTAPDKATIQKAADALTKAGYFGKCSDSDIKIDASTGAENEEVKSLKIVGVHLCCPKCVMAVNHALEKVPGVVTNTATKNAEMFVVTGDFKDSDVFKALQKAGLTGKVQE